MSQGRVQPGSTRETQKREVLLQSLWLRFKGYLPSRTSNTLHVRVRALATLIGTASWRSYPVTHHAPKPAESGYPNRAPELQMFSSDRRNVVFRARCAGDPVGFSVGRKIDAQIVGTIQEEKEEEEEGQSLTI